MGLDDNMVFGLDFGSSTIRAVVCEIDRQYNVTVRGMGTAVTNGIKKGKIVDTMELARSLSRAIKRAAQSAGVTPTRAIANVPLWNITFTHNEGIISSRNDDGLISETDQQAVLRQAMAVPRQADQTLMHAIPLYYRVRNRMVATPIGEPGDSVRVHAHLVIANKSNIMAVTRILRQLNIQLKGVVYDPIATAQLALTDSERWQGGILFDVGGQFTKVSIFKNNLLQKSVVVPIGGTTLTGDIATCLSVSIPEAERIKVHFAELPEVDEVSPEMIEVTDINGERQSIKKLIVCQIVEARIAELMRLIKKQLRFDFGKTYPIVLIGGGSQIHGFHHYVLKDIGLPVRVGIPELHLHSGANSSDAGAVGLVTYGIRSKAIGYVAPQQKRIWRSFLDWLIEG